MTRVWRFRIRKAAQKNRIDYAEDAGIYSDPKGRQDCDCRKARIAAKHSQAIADIQQAPLDESPAATRLFRMQHY
jgi:hypothetical protein